MGCMACTEPQCPYKGAFYVIPSKSLLHHYSPLFLPHTLYSLRFENATKYSTKQLNLETFGSSTTRMHYCNYARNGWLKVILTLPQCAKGKHYKARERRL
jgi:hypothetical protein